MSVVYMIDRKTDKVVAAYAYDIPLFAMIAHIQCGNEFCYTDADTVRINAPRPRNLFTPAQPQRATEPGDER
jgi:hypothetical protein